MCSRSDIEHLQPEPEPQPAPARDPLWPNGNRPLCGQCHERYVYMAGLCGRCWAEWSQAEAATARERHERAVRQPEPPMR